MKVPKNELRDFYSFELENNIPVIYVKDTKIKKPAFYFAIKTGYFSDPDKFPGLAHFLEHLIFMGSDEYTDENYFNEKLSKFQGMTNAYTDKDKTVYYFNSLEKGFEEILDIFYNLIKNPLLSKESQKREVNAVNSEHQKNLLNDSWRLNSILNELADEDHLLRKFGTGNKDTLDNDEVINAVKKFHKSYYHKNNFYICLIGNKDKDYYENILNNNFGTLTTELEKNNEYDNLKLPYTKRGRHIYLPSESNKKKLYMIWDMKRIDSKKNPFSLINEISTNMKINSLQKILVNKKFAKSVGFSLEDIKDNYMIIMLIINLTDTGVERINTILNICDNYFNFLKNQYVDDLIENFKKKQIINFDNAMNDDSMTLGNNLIEVMLEDLNEPLFYNFDYSELSQIHYQCGICKLLEDCNIILLLTKNKFESTNIKKLKTYNEKYYNIEYYDIKLNKDNTKIDYSFEIPKKNKYLEEPKLKIKNISTDIKRNNRNFSRFNSSWKTPKVYVSILVDYPYFEKDNLAIKQTLLVLAYQIKEYFYDALLVGYSIGISEIESKNMLNITISGYNNKINELINELLDKLNKFDKVDDYIKMVNTEYKYSLDKYKTDSPFYLAIEMFKKVIPNNKSRQYLSENYTILTKEKFNDLVGKILEGNKNYYYYGNYNTILSSKKTFKITLKPNKILNNETIIHPNKKETNKAILIVYNIGEYTIKCHALIKLLNSIMADNFFDNLRTKNQVGYLVKQNYSVINNNIYLFHHIQTEKDLGYIEECIINFNNEYINTLKNLADDELEKLKTLVIIDIEKEYDNMEEQYLEDLNEIINNKCVFNRKKLIVEKVKEINKSILVNFLNSLITKKSIYKVENKK